MLLEGLQLPLTTPFYPDGRLNLRKLEQSVAAYSKTPAAGLAVLSGNGEPAMLADEETLEALRAAIAAASAEKVMLAGAFRESVKGTLAVVDAAAVLGYDAALVTRPRGLGDDARGTQETLTYFQAVADRSAIPLVICDAGAGLTMEMVAELAGHPRIAGMVAGDAAPERVAALREATAEMKREVTVTAVFAAVTGRMLARHRPSAGTVLSAEKLAGGEAVVAIAASAASTSAALKTRTKTVGFQILAGSTARMLDALLAGAVGAMPPFAACAPQACYEVLAAWKDGDRGLAEEKQERLQAVAKRVEEELGIVAVKFGCDLNGYCGGQPRLPRLPLTGAEREEVETLMHGLRS
jgi:4-hydroxy-2-oxoglutarate aldolase